MAAGRLYGSIKLKCRYIYVCIHLYECVCVCVCVYVSQKVFFMLTKAAFI